jgi:1,2-diacylglycerol 3-beta-galactosyltransferase
MMMIMIKLQILLLWIYLAASSGRENALQPMIRRLLQQSGRLPNLELKQHKQTGLFSKIKSCFWKQSPYYDPFSSPVAITASSNPFPNENSLLANQKLSLRNPVFQNYKILVEKIKAVPWIRNHGSTYYSSVFSDDDRMRSTKNRFFHLFSFLRKGNNSLNKKKILILMSDTGGGHRASAQALDEALQQQFPGAFNVEILDIWTNHANYPFNQFVPVYRFLAKYRLMWSSFYAYGSFPPTKKLTELLSWFSSFDNFSKAIQRANPDLVVSVHPLCQLMPLSVVKRLNQQERIPQGKPPIPFITIVTDLGGAHRCWFDSRVDGCYVPSEAVRALALRNGIPAEKIIMKGLPIRSSFWGRSSSSSSSSFPLVSPFSFFHSLGSSSSSSSSLISSEPSSSRVTPSSSSFPSSPVSQEQKERMRTQLGLDSHSKTVLLMGGGDGVGGLRQIAQEVLKRLQELPFPSQLVVICGHNQRTFQELQQSLSLSQEKQKKEKESKTMTMTMTSNNVGLMIKGFVQNIDQFMTAADCLVTKAGPGTIAESMTLGLPLILSSFLPGQVSRLYFMTIVTIIVIVVLLLLLGGRQCSFCGGRRIRPVYGKPAEEDRRCDSEFIHQ